MRFLKAIAVVLSMLAVAFLVGCSAPTSTASAVPANPQTAVPVASSPMVAPPSVPSSTKSVDTSQSVLASAIKGSGKTQLVPVSVELGSSGDVVLISFGLTSAAYTDYTIACARLKGQDVTAHCDTQLNLGGSDCKLLATAPEFQDAIQPKLHGMTPTTYRCSVIAQVATAQ